METKSQINALRAEFVKFGINGYIIPSTDEYGSEYTSESARRLEYITGFTGSNGVAVITLSQSLFFTDSRYFEQARIELDKEFQIYDLKILREKLVGFDFEIGYDDMLFTEKQLNTFKSAKLKAIDGNLVDSIWQNKPEKPGSKIFHYPIEYSGEEFASKIARVRENMVSDYVLVTAADSICWLLNIRASDVEFCPLMLGYLVFSKDKIWLFINNPGRICLVEPHLPGLIVKDESEVKNFLFKLSGTVAVDLSFAPAGLARLCKNKLDIADVCQHLKACKNDVEINGFVETHIKDAIVMCEMLVDIKCLVKIGDNLTEYDISCIVTDYRRKQKGFICNSFPPIVAFAENGAIIHYRPVKESSKTVMKEGILLLDSGGHYFGGTTDVTRTVCVKKPDAEIRRRYTQVLKGNIALASIKFPEGVSGSYLDSFARMFLWNDGLDYGHSTGHGVGSALSVHEGPQSISKFSNVPLKAGMVLSIEPGFYKTGEYGIRIEDLVYVKKSKEDGFLEFAPLTLVPYCKDLIETRMLTKAELSYIRKKQSMIMEKVYPHLSLFTQSWVKRNMV